MVDPKIQKASHVRSAASQIKYLCIFSLIVYSLALCVPESGQAAIKFVWMVSGAQLPENSFESLGYINANSASIEFKDPRYTVKCGLLSATNAKIEEKARGIHKEELEFTECAITEPEVPKKDCLVKEGKIVTGPLEGEIVEGIGLSAGKVLLEFGGKANKANETVVPITLEKVSESCGIIKTSPETLRYEGFLLSELVTTEAPVQKFLFEPEEESNFTNYQKEDKGAGLRAGCANMHVKGEIKMELKSPGKFGPA